MERVESYISSKTARLWELEEDFYLGALGEVKFTRSENATIIPKMSPVRKARGDISSHKNSAYDCRQLGSATAVRQGP